MSEAEFDLMLEAVSTAIAPALEDDMVAHKSAFTRLPKAANDNKGEWPLVPFPDGWYAAC